MNIYISFEEYLSEVDAYDLKQLASEIENECDLTLSLESEKIGTGQKDGGLTIGIAIASIGLTALQTLISFLQYWDSRQPKYSMSITLENDTFLIDNIPKIQFEKKLRQIQLESPESPIEIKIIKKL